MKLSSILDLLKQETDIKSKTITINVDDKGEVSSFKIEEVKGISILPSSNQPGWINVKNPWWDDITVKPLSTKKRGITDIPEITEEPQLPPEAYKGNRPNNVRYDTTSAPNWKYDSNDAPIWNYMSRLGIVSNTNHNVKYPQSSSDITLYSGFNTGGVKKCSK